MCSNRLPKQSTLSDVAALAGVSAQTVSRVVNRTGVVAQETRARVEQAIAELGYRPNSVARSLVNRQSKTLGLIVTDFAQGFFPDTTRTIEREAAEHGYAVYMVTVSDDAQRIRTAFDRLRDDRFAGVIVNTSTAGYEIDLQRAASEGFPIVLVHEELAGVPAVIHWSGFRTGARMAVEHLISIGRRQIAFLATPNMTLIDQDKLTGYREALAEAQLPFDPSLVVKSPRDFQGGYVAMADLLLRHADVDACFVASDVRAVGVLRYLALHGIDVPGEIAIVAFGASTMASMVTPSLSTIRVPRRLIGQLAVQSLLEMLGGAPGTPRHVHQQPELVLGESSLAGRNLPTRLPTAAGLGPDRDGDRREAVPLQ
ncbi:MAG: LacI family DNA-binding transcriptional regulator [Chloroflexia bacterium]|nr:LacI family DNA-binding transcriptional regulator [Chloroflexia bacterium]MDQ3411001.1 LacI family transcriptional regulator [Chloroflexota bacterium]